MTRHLVLAFVIAGACGPAATSGAGRATVDDSLAARLTLPPTDATSSALDELARRASAGSIDAAWTRVHYLLDAFDSARFSSSESAREILFAALDAGAEARGPEATNRVIDALVRATDDVLALDPEHAEASRARVLLRFDREPPTAPPTILQRTIELATVARAPSDLATNACLRLAGWCLRALDDAVAAPRGRAAKMLAHCLYPLYEADPAPYFADDPARRPPPPAPADLVAGTDALLAIASKTPSRAAAVATSLRSGLAERRAELLAGLPTVPAPGDLGVPTARPAALYDMQPLVQASARVEANALRDRLLAQLAADGRAQVAVALPPDDAGALYPVAAAARAAGASELLVAVAASQKLQVPAGDYWHRAGGLEPGLRQVNRLGVLPIRIAEADPDSAAARDASRDATRARLDLHLLVSNKGWVVRTPGSVLADSSGPLDERVAAVRAALAAVRSAFADEDVAYLAVEPGASAEQLVRALEAARTTADGAPLFSAFFLVTGIETGKPDGVGDRVGRRAAARVAVVPQDLERRVPALRACYQRRLDDRPVAGTVRLELDDNRTRAVSGPATLRECALAALADLIESENMASAEIRFSLAR